MQKFIARDRREFPNGAVGWAPGGAFDCLGPWAKVENCPIYQSDLRRTVYATNYADSFFSIPAATKVFGRRVVGYITLEDNSPIFRPLTDQRWKISPPKWVVSAVRIGGTGEVLWLTDRGMVPLAESMALRFDDHRTAKRKADAQRAIYRGLTGWIVSKELRPKY